VQANAEPDATQLAFVSRLAASASSLHENLVRLGADEPTTSALKSLAAAYEEDMVTDWVRMYVLQIVGHDDRSIRDRFPFGRRHWEAAEPSLVDLQSRAPDSPFTHDVRDSLRAQVASAYSHLKAPVSGFPDYPSGLTRMVEGLDQIWPQH
jgi:hypothetical protein